MRIDRLFGLGQPTLSFEFFPPKSEGGWAQLYQAIGELHSLKPSYVSVTYGAGGSTRGKTLDLVTRIQNELKIRSMAHLTCVGHTADELGKILDDLWNAGIHNVLALRGDPPAGQTNFVATQGGFSNADGLVSYIRTKQSTQDFCVGVAGYPEGHPQCLNLIRDMEHLQRKVDNGANFVVTQLFFDNADYYRFRDQARSAGIKVPLVAGIMPISNVGQIKRFVSMCGSKIPQPLLLKLEKLEADPEAVHQAGVEYATQQCQDLLANGCEGIHFYTLNKSKATVQICKELKTKHAA
jgi:methylenetetrahydrofolate reductase (NADPH)